MAEQKDSAELAQNKTEMMQRLTADSSRAFLDDIKTEMLPTKLQAQTEWWKTLKDETAPASIAGKDPQEFKSNGWNLIEDQYYNKLTKYLKDGSYEVDTYENNSGQRVGTTIQRYTKESREKGDAAQTISLSYHDGQNIYGATVISGNFNSEFRAYFNENGSVKSAYEYGQNHDFVDYSFRDDGSLYEAVTRSKQTSDVINDQLFDRAGALRSDYNPLYLYEKIHRPLHNLYMGLRETRIKSIF